MTQRIQNLFAHSKAFVGYFVVGDGGLDYSFSVAKALLDGGVNLLELGVPFSDPVADGPVIQRAAERALQAKTRLADVIQLAAKIRAYADIPLILFSYFNPLLAHNPQQWLPRAKQAGLDGILVVDLPWEEGKAFYQQCKQHEITPIAVVTSATSEQRFMKIVRHANGFLYYACQKGTTGVRAELPPGIAEKLAMFKQHTRLPIVVGFGIGKPESAQEILNYAADGFVVGSLFVKAMEQGVPPQEISQLARSFKIPSL